VQAPGTPFAIPRWNRVQTSIADFFPGDDHVHANIIEARRTRHCPDDEQLDHRRGGLPLQRPDSATLNRRIACRQECAHGAGGDEPQILSRMGVEDLT